MKKLVFTIFVVLACLLFGRNSYAQQDKPTEYHVKAVFLYNFANFVKWPEKAFSSKTDPIIIGVFGKNPFGEALDRIVDDEYVDERPIVIKYSESTEELSSCHILYIATFDKELLALILGKVNNTNILTVGEVEKFTGLGGIIGFVMEENKVQFDINMKAAEKANLKVSSKLQKVARKIIKD
ncbi:MAG: YfiR family protein [candidate division Zixibacteria bacterium]|nr:YfiR family protein [candidate division Zixibacteria bacterium]